MISVSVIIPTYNGEHKIIDILQALENQTYTDFEVIVMVDGSTDQTVNKLNNQSFNFKLFRVFEQVNQGRAEVRNNGAKLAVSDLLVFFDDDMVPLENCVREHVHHHALKNNTILTGGLCENVTGTTTDIQKYKLSLSRSWSIPLQGQSEMPLNRQNLFISAANFSISKELFFELNGFDKELNDAEDFDLAVRAYQKGIQLYYNHKAFAFHNDFITCKSYIKRQRQYKAAYQSLRKRKELLLNAFPLRYLSNPNGFKAIIYNIFTFKFWIWSIDNFNWLTVFPKKIRYKIYDIVIMANGVYYPDRIKL